MTPQVFMQVKNRTAAGHAIDRTKSWFLQTLLTAPAGTDFPTKEDIHIGAGVERNWVLQGRAHQLAFAAVYEHVQHSEDGIRGRLRFHHIDEKGDLGRELLSIMLDEHAVRFADGGETSQHFIGETQSVESVLRLTKLQILRGIQETLPSIG